MNSKHRVIFRNRLRRVAIGLPASKSISARALIINAMCDEKEAIYGLAKCDDTDALVKALGSSSCMFDIGAAGTAMRFLTAFLARRPGEYTITGTERMKRRPVKLLVEALNAIGADIRYVDEAGYPPLRISGRELGGGEVRLPGEVSSQYVSALLMIGPMMANGLTVTLDGNITSRPYIELTMGLMRRFNARVEWEDARRIRVWAQGYKSVPMEVERDWSAASYWYSMVSLSPGAEVELPGLAEVSMQGDASVSKIYERLGVGTEFVDGKAIIRSGGEICKRLEYDFSDSPDLAQTLAVSCCLLNVPFRFTGLHTLRIKETDRIAALIGELGRLGYVAESVDGRSLAWEGERGNSEERPLIRTYEDHRMAMAFAPAALLLKEGIGIERPGVVSKSYPDFWRDMILAGAEITDLLP